MSCFGYVRHLPRVLKFQTCILDVPNLKSPGTPTTLVEGFLAFLSTLPGSDDSFYSDLNVFIIIQHRRHESLKTSLNELQTTLILRSLLFKCVLTALFFKISYYRNKPVAGVCGNKMPTRCNRGFYCRSYCLHNTFRASLCPSSGAQEYYTVVAACGILCCCI